MSDVIIAFYGIKTERRKAITFKVFLTASNEPLFSQSFHQIRLVIHEI